MGTGEGRAVVNIICFYVYNSRGGLPYHFCFPVENDPAFSRTVIVLRLFMFQGVKQGGGSLFAIQFFCLIIEMLGWRIASGTLWGTTFGILLVL